MSISFFKNNPVKLSFTLHKPSGVPLNPANMIALRVLKPLPVKAWTHIAVTYDGSSRAAGTHVYLNGAPAEVDVDHDTLTSSMLPFGQGEGIAPSVSFG